MYVLLSSREARIRSDLLSPLAYSLINLNARNFVDNLCVGSDSLLLFVLPVSLNLHVCSVLTAFQVLLVDRKLSESVYPRPGLMSNTSEVDAANPDLAEHPRFKEVLPLLECELRKGEVLYIPPLFWHHIESLEVSFSVSFWWGKRRTL